MGGGFLASKEPMRRAVCVAVGLLLAQTSASAQEIRRTGPIGGAARRRLPPPPPETPEETEGAKAAAREAGFDLECVKRAQTKADLLGCVIVPDQVEVRAKPPPRSASDWEVDEETIKNAPHRSGEDVLTQVPGLFVTDRGVP